MLSQIGKVPLVVKIVIGAVLGVILGEILGKDADKLKPISDLILQLLRLLATPLIALSLLHSLLSVEISGKKTTRLLVILMTNTVIAILIGLLVANIVQPGNHLSIPIDGKAIDKKPFDFVNDLLLGKFPKDFVAPFASNDIIGVLMISIAIGIAVRKFKTGEFGKQVASLTAWVNLGLKVTMTMLHWIFALVPIAVLAVVARVVGTTGYGVFLGMIWFVVSVVAALALMLVFYIIRLKTASNIGPKAFFKGGLDAFLLAFSTASSAATLPVTYRCATENLGLKEDSASMGVMVGGTFNHDGTALYEAMAALLISQALHLNLGIGQQAVVVLMSVIASVGAAGIPEAGLVTMLAVFTAVQLPTEYIALLLPLDWFLDRCRTTINVVGDLASTCIVDKD